MFVMVWCSLGLATHNTRKKCNTSGASIVCVCAFAFNKVIASLDLPWLFHGSTPRPQLPPKLLITLWVALSVPFCSL